MRTQHGFTKEELFTLLQEFNGKHGGKGYDKHQWEAFLERKWAERVKADTVFGDTDGERLGGHA